eukprot:43318-Eustigmatos_ZCMA.PRE.1
MHGSVDPEGKLDAEYAAQAMVEAFNGPGSHVDEAPSCMLCGHHVYYTFVRYPSGHAVAKPESPSNAQSYAQEQFPATPTKPKAEPSSQPQAHVNPEQ